MVDSITAACSTLPGAPPNCWKISRAAVVVELPDDFPMSPTIRIRFDSPIRVLGQNRSADGFQPVDSNDLCPGSRISRRN